MKARIAGLLLALLMPFGAAQAAVVFTDDFSTNAQFITSSGADVWDTVALNSDLDRTIAILSFTTLAEDPSSLRASTVNGWLSGQNPPGSDAGFAVAYSGATFAPIAAAPGDVSFTVRFLDLSPTTASLFVDGAIRVSQPMTAQASADPGPLYSFNYTGDWTGGFALIFQGPSGYDITVDNVQFSVPAPGVLALLGIGLLGFGLRRGRTS